MHQNAISQAYSSLFQPIPAYFTLFHTHTWKEKKLWTLKFWEYRFGRKKALMTTNLKSQQNRVNQIFNPNAFFFFLLTGYLKGYYHAIYIVFTYYTSFAGYEDDILELFLICTFKDPKLAGKWTNLAENPKKNLTPQSSWSLFFSKSVHTMHTR